MGLWTHDWLKKEHLRDYAQTVTLAKLIAGCPPAQGHKCPRCQPVINGQIRRLFCASYTLVLQDLGAANMETLKRSARRQQAHRRFLEMWDSPGRRLTVNGYAKKLKVAHSTIKLWMGVERQKIKGIERLSRRLR